MLFPFCHQNSCICMLTVFSSCSFLSPLRHVRSIDSAAQERNVITGKLKVLFNIHQYKYDHHVTCTCMRIFEISWFQETLLPILLIFRMFGDIFVHFKLHIFRKHPEDSFSCLCATYRQRNKIMAYLTFHKWLVSVCNIHNDIWILQTKTSH